MARPAHFSQIARAPAPVCSPWREVDRSSPSIARNRRFVWAGRANAPAHAQQKEEAMTVFMSGRAAFYRRVAIAAVVVAWSGAAIAAGISASVGGVGVGVGGVGASVGVGGTGASVGVGVGGTSASVSVGGSSADGVSATASVGATGTTGDVSANVGADAASGANGPAVRLASRRLCPRILAAPELYDDDLVILCRSAARL
jgi:hypothetical protein